MTNTGRRPGEEGEAMADKAYPMGFKGITGRAEPPRELWMLWGMTLDQWCAAPDMPDAYVVAMSREAAQELADREGEISGQAYVPVRVK